MQAVRALQDADAAPISANGGHEDMAIDERGQAEPPARVEQQDLKDIVHQVTATARLRKECMAERDRQAINEARTVEIKETVRAEVARIRAGEP